MTFQDLQLLPPLLQAIEEEKYTQPTPIQERAIPVVLKGIDLLGCAQTGTGKTAAFAIPILQLLTEKKSEKKHIKALILTPTRELAIQIEESFKSYGRHLNIRHAVVFGGVNQHSQVQQLKRGVDVLVATPGRLLDLMGQGHVRLNELSIFVLDEADRMLDMGFVHDVKRVIAELPKERQSLFFSATMPNEIIRLANTILTNPIKVEVTPPSTTAQTVKQELHYVEYPEKRAKLIDLIESRNIERALVFTRTKHGANRVAKELNKAGIRAEAIHGNKSQNARQEALNNFKMGKTRMLVATDIAARGIDIDELAYVINFEVPNVAETYVHRIGRTGRAGHSGLALSLVDSEERAYIKDIQKLIGLQIPVVGDIPPAIAFIPTEERRAIARQNRPPRNSGDRSKPQRNNTSSPREASKPKPTQTPKSQHPVKPKDATNAQDPVALPKKRRKPKKRRPASAEGENATTAKAPVPAANKAQDGPRPHKKKRYSKNYKKRYNSSERPNTEKSAPQTSNGGWLSKISSLFKR
jgi:ATP-dependent RNA helicase RhlE